MGGRTQQAPNRLTASLKLKYPSSFRARLAISRKPGNLTLFSLSHRAHAAPAGQPSHHSSQGPMSDTGSGTHIHIRHVFRIPSSVGFWVAFTPAQHAQHQCFSALACIRSPERSRKPRVLGSIPHWDSVGWGGAQECAFLQASGCGLDHELLQCIPTSWLHWRPRRPPHRHTRTLEVEKNQFLLGASMALQLPVILEPFPGEQLDHFPPNTASNGSQATQGSPCPPRPQLYSCTPNKLTQPGPNTSSSSEPDTLFSFGEQKDQSHISSKHIGHMVASSSE